MVAAGHASSGVRSSLDLRAVRFFVGVAEQLHFGRTAAQMDLSQSALSRSIRGLEEQLGARLLVRSSRRVELTDAGKVFLEHARALLAREALALEDLCRATAGLRPVLRVGFVAGFAGPLTEPLLSRFFTAHPEIELQLDRLPWSEQTQAIRDGCVDVGFVRTPWPEEGLRIRPVLSEPRVLLTSTRNKLAAAKTVRLRELAGEPICRPIGGPREGTEFWTADAGQDVSGPQVKSIDEALEYVAAGIAVAIVPQSMAEQFPRKHVAIVALQDAPPSQIALAWRRDAVLAELRMFLQTVRTVLAEEPSFLATRASISLVTDAAAFQAAGDAPKAAA